MSATQTSPFVEHSHIVTFADEKVNLKRDDVTEYREQVNRLRDRLAEYIKEHPDYDLVKMLHSGSVAKGTALKTVNDMDVAVYIKPSDKTADESLLLSWLVERLKEVYPTMKPEQFTIQHHCVTVSFSGSGLDVDVVPVIADANGHGDGYLIVKDTGERVRTSISMHLEFIRKRKKACADFAQVVRLMKWWARNQKIADDDFRLKSFLIELICARLADDGLDFSDYPNALQKVFAYIVSSDLKKRIAFTDNYAADKIPKKPADVVIEVFDPVNPDNNVAAKYSEGNRKKIVDAAADALDALTEARYATTKGRSVAMWQVVFGPSFQVES